MSIEWATATMVLFLPLLTISRRYCAARYVFFVREAAHAAWQRARRNQTLPLRVFPERRFPALSLLPGQSPAQAASRRFSIPASAGIPSFAAAPEGREVRPWFSVEQLRAFPLHDLLVPPTRSPAPYHTTNIANL